MRDRCDKYVCKSGSRTKLIYAPKVEDDGTIKLIPSGKEDWYGKIQSWKDSVDIHVILKKCLNGDTSALSRVQGFYGDVNMFPKSKPEMLQLMIDAERNFDSLPVDVKEKFGHDIYKFVAAMQDPKSFMEKLGVKLKVVEDIKEEVKSV